MNQGFWASEVTLVNQEIPDRKALKEVRVELDSKVITVEVA